MAQLHVASYILMLISTLKLVDSTCTYLGRTYKTADRFPKGESCNMCTCRMSGKVDCTTITCYQFPMYVGDDIHPHLPPPHRAMPRHDDPERTMNIMWSRAGTIYSFPKFSF
uniref:Pacifastin domain-containing protein n=1 Tax=Magallana gigas TaxID=29159 RepID=A0A8W8P682_MAGGI